jgi:hypothetical protein
MFSASGGKTKQFEVNGGRVVSLPTAGLPDGLYYLKFYASGNLLFTRKIAVIH